MADSNSHDCSRAVRSAVEGGEVGGEEEEEEEDAMVRAVQVVCL